MRVVWSDPYVWLHLAGLATVPLLLELCFVGLAVGEPILPVWLEFFLVAVVGIGPILWMQWQRPFCIFSVVALALAPASISDPRRRMLRFFRTSVNQVMAIAIAITLAILLWQLYRFSPIAADLAPFSSRWLGLGMAAIAFLGVNLFTQVPVSVLRLLIVSDNQLAAQEPYPPERIPLDFVLFGIRLRHILPEPSVRPLSSPPTPIPQPTEPPAPETTEASGEPSAEVATEAIPEASESITDSEEQRAAEVAAEESIKLADSADATMAAEAEERSPDPTMEASSTPDAAEATESEETTEIEARSPELPPEEDITQDVSETSASEGAEAAEERSPAPTSDEVRTPEGSEANASESIEDVSEAIASEVTEEAVVLPSDQTELTTESETEPSEAAETIPTEASQEGLNPPIKET
ncbi:low-complexity tail membrane protein [Vacuolonema iberomarrocanum]|uniref:low-complexity tail membrane protein n=1 Tax=Vacuolonema iberomarrocanum TaxID=3454632 RepID=UPI001A0554CE|nr:low-complexity tail membrane protein [filamentous cyanobacterium LEGE 07170]